MPKWEPVVEEAPRAPPAPPASAAGPELVELPPRRASGRVAKPAVRRVADPFDADDDRANCLRCGYAIERARERRGLMTCAECG
jgi:hypothetical protein